MSQGITGQSQANGEAAPLFEPLAHQGRDQGNGCSTQTNGCKDSVRDEEFPEGVNARNESVSTREKNG